MKRSLSPVVAVALGVVSAVLCATGRPAAAQHPSRMLFSDGFRAIQQKNWGRAAELMQEALAKSPADGTLIRVYGRWFEPYVPHYFLGVALYELGCYEATRDHLELSVVRQQNVRGGREKLATLESLLEKCEEYLRLGISQRDGSQCDRWQKPPDGPGPPADDDRPVEQIHVSLNGPPRSYRLVFSSPTGAREEIEVEPNAGLVIRRFAVPRHSTSLKIEMGRGQTEDIPLDRDGVETLQITLTTKVGFWRSLFWIGSSPTEAYLDGYTVQEIPRQGGHTTAPGVETPNGKLFGRP